MSTSIVTIDPEIQSGAPVFAGTRVPIKNLFDFVEAGDSVEEFLAQFPSVSREMVLDVLNHAHRTLLADAHPA